jgi:hypothetical protein
MTADVTLAFLIAVAATAVGHDADPVEVLARAHYFSGPYAGRAPELFEGTSTKPSAVEEAFTSLVAEHKQKEFLSLTKAEQPASRLFGLCGLKQLRAADYRSVRRRLARDTKAIVPLVSIGCIARHITLRDALKEGRAFDTICDTLRGERSVF